MKTKIPKNLFITGTDTDVGKTVVAAMFTLGLKAGYWKPIQSGADPQSDTDWVKCVTELPQSHFFKESYCFSKPLSPHAASKIDNIKIDLQSILLPDTGNLPHLIIEGAGGLMVPLNDDFFILDLIKKLNIPVLIIARSTLGTINHTLLTLEQLRRHHIPIFGVALNGPKNEGNKNAIEKYGKVTVIAEIEPMQNITKHALLNEFNKMDI